jgi:hypothetical protein
VLAVVKSAAFPVAGSAPVELMRAPTGGMYQLGGATEDVVWSVDLPPTGESARLIEGAVHTLHLDRGQGIFVVGAAAAAGNVSVWLVYPDEG